MPKTHRDLIGATLALAMLTSACASHVPALASAPEPPAAVAPAVAAPQAAQVPTDPVADLLAASSIHFEKGQSELQLGHLDSARAEFNKALDVLLESSYGARSEPRIREHFDRLVERISAFEVTSLAQGDGFTEKKYEPASIDELLGVSTFAKADAAPQIAEAAASDTASHDIEIPLNGRVLSFVDLFSGRLKGYLQDGLSRGARFLPMIQDVFRAEGLPLDLAYVPLVESAFKTDALSRASAKGMWQFMRGTALENGLKHDWYIDERAEPEKATRAAAKYLKTLYGMFGDWHLALASYNGGPGRVQNAIKRAGGVKDFWQLSASRKYLPQETRDYVPLILAAMIIARNPAQYGLDIAPSVVEVPEVETVTLPVAVDLRRVAEWVGISVQAMQDLNPELRRWTTPVNAKDYELKIPSGTAELVQARLADAGADAVVLNWHTVRKGETLTTIARKLKVSRTDLAEANYLSVRSQVRPGQQLIIPRPPALLLNARADSPAAGNPVLVAEANVDAKKIDEASAGGVEPVANAGLPSAVGTTATSAQQKSKLVYRVKSGDTLTSIARLFQTSVASLKKWNSLQTNIIRAGQRLTILTPVGALATN